VNGLVDLPVWFTPTGERGQREAPEESKPAPAVTRWVRRRKRKPAGQGARYQAPLTTGGRTGPAVEDAPERAARTRTRRAAPQGAGARYQAPFAEQAHTPDPLEQLLETWRPRG
jgi:hypothetical protein